MGIVIVTIRPPPSQIMNSWLPLDRKIGYNEDGAFAAWARRFAFPQGEKEKDSMSTLQNTSYRAAIDRVTPYSPGKPIEEVARELGLDAKTIIKLASNENPLGPSPRAIEAMREHLRLMCGCTRIAIAMNCARRWPACWAWRGKRS